MEVSERFAENLRHLRKRTGMSQEELGFRSSLHRTQIGLLEKGVRVPKIDTLVKLASCLGVRIDCALLDGIEWVRPDQGEALFHVRSRRDEEILMAGALSRPRTKWWEEAFAVLGAESIDGTKMPAVGAGIREDGMVLIRVLDLPFGVNREELVWGLARPAGGGPEREERFTRSVSYLVTSGLLAYHGAQVLPTRAAKRFDGILRAAHELRYSRGDT